MTMPVSGDSWHGELPPLDASIVAVLRACGGRLRITDLIFELRRRGIAVQSVISGLRGLGRRGLVRGPLLRTPMYELTMDEWDIGRQARTGDHQPDDIGSPLRAGSGAMQVVRPARPGLAASNDDATGPTRVLNEPTARTAPRRR